jgi:hypothetical protein
MFQLQPASKDRPFSFLNLGLACSLCFGILFFLFLPAPLISAQQRTAADDPGQEASLSQAQATMASLFGRGAKMPGIPRIEGTIALPSFDSSGMKIDEATLDQAQRGERASGNGQR